MSNGISRRTLIQGSGAALAAGALGTRAAAAPAISAEVKSGPSVGPIKKAVKYGMVAGDAPMVEKFRLLRRLGYDGVELDSPNGFERDEVLRARDESGLRIHGVVDSIHWGQRLSDPDPGVRKKAVEGLETAIRDSHAYGGSSALLVPGRVTNAETENANQVWERSIAGIREVLPLAADLGVFILIENVWNGFLYDHDGSDDQSADRYAAYIDAIGSPWVGAYHDLGNHRKYGLVEEWVRTLGKRIVKVDVKGWGKADGWVKIGDGDVDWPKVREALAEVGFTGWATAEVGAGDEAHLKDVKARMDRVLGS